MGSKSGPHAPGLRLRSRLNAIIANRPTPNSSTAHWPKRFQSVRLGLHDHRLLNHGLCNVQVTVDLHLPHLRKGVTPQAGHQGIQRQRGGNGARAPQCQLKRPWAPSEKHDLGGAHAHAQCRTFGSEAAPTQIDLETHLPDMVQTGQDKPCAIFSEWTKSPCRYQGRTYPSVRQYIQHRWRLHVGKCTRLRFQLPCMALTRDETGHFAKGPRAPSAASGQD